MAGAFSSESLPRTRSGVETGSRQENASNQESGASVRFYRNGNGSGVGITTPLIRLAIGLLQGAALLTLYQASEQKTWPATDGFVFAPLVAVATFVPLIVISALGHLRLRTLVAWAVVATLLCAGLAVYDIFRDPILVAAAGTVRVVPSWVMWWSLAAILFIIHILTISGEADRKLIASYPTHFDIAWKHGVQFVLAGCFVGLLWGLLFLGAELFRLIRIEFLAELLKRTTFSIPVTALAFSYAIHVTDVRASIVQGARTLVLILMSWLLPLMALLGAAFVVALVFTGLAPLWSTRHAAGILFGAAAALIFLVNAAYQDGREQLAAETEGPLASVIAERAKEALHAKSAWETTLAERRLHITVISPNGATLPEDFVQQDWNAFLLRWKLPNCLVTDARCEAILTDLDGDGQPEILLFSLPFGSAAAFKKGHADGTWTYFGTVANATCPGVRDAIHAGHFETIQSVLKEFTANGQRLFISTDCAVAR
jgi:hypothetical protein